jgi:PAS domain S-box-containing protein
MAGDTSNRRRTIYIGCILLSGLVCASVNWTAWRGTAQLHLLMELAATLLAWFVGTVALARYYSKKDNTFLCIGTAFIGAGFLDGYHAIVSDPAFVQYFPSPPPSLIPWSGFASRFFLSVLLFLSWALWKREVNRGDSGRVPEVVVYVFAGTFTLACFLFFAFVPLPLGYTTLPLFHRPQESVPVLLFVLALIGYLRKGSWKTDPFEHWLVLSIILCASQSFFISTSDRLYDAEYFAAHAFKDLSYVSALIGLIVAMYNLFVHEEVVIAERTQKLHEEIEERRRAQATTAALLNFSDSVIQALPVAFAVFDQQGKWLKWNHKLEELCGYSAQDLPQVRVFDTIAEEYRELMRQKCREAVESGFTSAEVVLVTKDRRNIPSYLTAAPILVEGQICIAGVAMDISERKRAEEALRVSEARFRDLVETTDDWIWQTDADARYNYSSPTIKRHLGYEPEEIIGRRPPDLLAPEERESLIKTIQEAQAAPAPCPFTDERTYLAKDGRRVVLEVRGVPIVDTAGRSCGARGIARDTTERKRVQAALQESEEQFRQLAENIHEVFFIVAAEPARMTYISPAYEQVWGRPRHEIYDRANAWIDSVHPEDRENAAEGFRRSLSGAPTETEFRVIRPDGDIRWIHASSFPVCDSEGKFLRSVGIAEDITEQRRVLEEVRAARAVAEAASRVKSEFLANMSHEIRTPMNGILGMTELALDTNLTREQREYLLAVKSSGESLLRVLNDILDFSKVEAGKLDLELIEFSLQDCVGETVKALAVRAHEKGLELAYQVEPEVPRRVVGDPVRLRQILTNLVGNAIKFTVHGEVVLTLSAASGDDGRTSLNFTIKDTGIGIPPEKLASIFKPFVQGDTSTTRTYGGTGLGLAISTQLIELMGGRVSVESALGEGSRFQFTIAMTVPQEATQKPLLAGPEILVGVPVLIVDDNPTNRKILEHAARDWKMAPCAVGDGEAALREVEAFLQQGKQYRVALIDSHMPGMDGFALVERLQHNPRMAEAVIMMLTSSGQRGDAARCRRLGIAAYLVKPIGSGELMQALLVALGQSAEVVRPLVTRHSLREDRRGLRILVAEDNPVNQALILRLLQKQGNLPELARTGREAVAMAAAGRFDLAFMDVQMPEMDGFAATAAIRDSEQDRSTRLPIFAMTAHAMKGDKERCLAAGMDGYISKPVNFGKIQQVLDGVRAQTPNPTPVWDQRHALSGVGGDERLLREIAEMFLHEYPQAVSDLRRALAGHDAAMLGRVAHRLKGEVGCFGAGRSVSALVKLEDDVGQQDFVRISRAVDEVERALACFRQALEKFCQVPHESLSR